MALGAWAGLAGSLALPLGGTAQAAKATLPPIHHVYMIVLENENVSTTFGAGSPAPYLSKTLRARGAYLPKYYGTGHLSNDNYIAMISGQAPNADTQSDCQTYTDFPASTTLSYGQIAGAGCIYPAGVPTIASQLSAAGLAWRDYNDSMGADPTRESWSAATRPSTARTPPRARRRRTSTPHATTRSCTSTRSSTTRRCAIHTSSTSTRWRRTSPTRTRRNTSSLPPAFATTATTRPA